MVRKSKKSGLLASLGSEGQRAVTRHQKDDVDYGGGGNLPGGIDGGIAQLVDCRFGVYKSGAHEGEYFFIAAGIVKSPKEVNGVHVEGLRTQIMEPMCDTPEREGETARRTIEDHVSFVMNEMRKLGVDTTDLDVEELEDTAAFLKGEQPHFRFRTFAWEMGDRKGVKEQWRGVCDFEEDASDDSVVDETEEEEEDEKDLAALSEKADDDDDEASQLQLSELATEKGLDPDDYATWAELVEALEEETEEDDQEETTREDDEETANPEKGEVFSFKPPRAKKAVDCEVTAVFVGRQTCNLKNLDDGTLYKQVPWDSLMGAD